MSIPLREKHRRQMECVQIPRFSRLTFQRNPTVQYGLWHARPVGVCKACAMPTLSAAPPLEPSMEYRLIAAFANQRAAALSAL